MAEKDKKDKPVVGFYCPPEEVQSIPEAIKVEEKQPEEFWLLIKFPFDQYTKEVLVSDPKEIKAIVENGRLSNCLKIKPHK